MDKNLMYLDVINLLESVTELSCDIYPNVYEPDKKLYSVLIPYIYCFADFSERNLNIRISKSELIYYIDVHYGITKYMNKFDSKYDVSKGIEPYYDKIIKEYSSIEIAMLYNIYTNLSYINFKIHNGVDKRKSRKKMQTSFNLPDLWVSGLTIKIRKFFDKYITDEFNRFLLDFDYIGNDLMSRDVALEFENVPKFLKMMNGFCDMESDGFDLFEKYKFLSVDDFQSTSIMLITDYMQL